MVEIPLETQSIHTLAWEDKEINDFYLMEFNEPLEALRSNIKYPALVLTSLTRNFEVSNLDNILDLINGGFLIIGYPDQIDDFAGEMQFVSKMKQIGTDIIARMLNDFLK